MREYPPQIEIKPLDRPVNATIRVPGSKSITNRALVLGALSEPLTGCVIENALLSEDTDVMVAGLRVLGFRVSVDNTINRIAVHRGSANRPIPADEADLFVGNSGTTARFLTALAALGTGRYHFDGVARMRERPMGDLHDALRQLGSIVKYDFESGFPPFTVHGQGLRGGEVSIRATASSQFLSALLMAAPFAQSELTIRVEGAVVSAPYVEMTLRMMADFGVDVQTDDGSCFRVPSVPWYSLKTYVTEPDASSASYFFAAAAITNGKMLIPALGEGTLQADFQFVNVLFEMGCHVHSTPYLATVRGDSLRGIEIDMNQFSDTVMTLAAVACFAEGPTTIRNVAHIRHKESDRIAALATELRKLGVEVDEFPDGLRITPRPMHGAEIETYNDHRMAMSMALIGLKVPGVIIKNPGCVAKTYPAYWDDFEKLYG